MRGVKLTKRSIEVITPPQRGDLFVWDSELRGFAVRISPTGRRTYLVQYRNQYGRSRKLKIGVHGNMSPEQARRRAIRLLAEVAEGKDPAEEKEQRTGVPSMAELANRYLTEHAIPYKKESSIRSDRGTLNNHILPALGRLPVAEVTSAHVAKLHHQLRSKPIQANRTLSLLSKMFNLAELWGLRPDSTNPCRHIQKYKETSRERYLSELELARLGAVLDSAAANGLASPEAVAAIRLLLFSGARKGEILKLRWEQVDFDRRLLVLPDSKTGAKTIVINDAMMGVLESLHRGPTPWVIPGEGGKGHRINLDKAWRRIRKEARLEDVRIHDLRHTFGATATGENISLNVTGSLLGHKSTVTTKRYAHVAENPQRQASEIISRRISEALNQRDDRPSLTRI